jgi:hypothetical protein
MITVEELRDVITRINPDENVEATKYSVGDVYIYIDEKQNPPWRLVARSHGGHKSSYQIGLFYKHEVFNHTNFHKPADLEKFLERRLLLNQFNKL